jgi:glutathione synthase/RimK-type ligase-like ATP-grasp enzyme
MGLYYGAIDLIESNDGESYFLEVNPQGQFLFNEIDTEAPMSDAFADLLVDADPG